MSKEKVEKYKMEKAGRKLSLKKEKRIKTLIGCACVVGAVVLAGAVGYYSGNKNRFIRVPMHQAVRLLQVQR